MATDFSATDFSAFDFSAGYERLRRGFLLGEADQVPFIQQSHEFNMNYAGIDARDYYANPEAFIYGAFKTAHELGFDTPDICWDSYNIEAEALGAKLVTFPDLTPAIDNVEPLVRNERDLARLRPPKPGVSGRMPFAFQALDLFHELTGETPCLNFCAPFTLATQVMTFEDVVLGIKDDPAFIHKVMTFVTDEVLAPYINAFAAKYPDATAHNGGDAVASLPFITLDMLEDFSLQYVERLRALTGKRVVTDNWWGDAYAEAPEVFWDMKLRACPGHLKVQDPDLFKVGARRAKAHAGARDVSLLLGVSNNLLQDGPPEAIERRIHEYLEVAEPGGRSLLYLCNLGAQAPLAHVRAAVAAIEKFRRGERPYAGQHESGGEAAPTEASPVARAAKPKAGGGSLSEAQEAVLDDIYDAVVDGLEAEAVAGVRAALEDGTPLATILDDALIAAMEEIGELFSEGSIFVPEMLLSARAMKGGLELLRPLLTRAKTKPKGLVLLATVQGDVHDIGKNLVGMMLEGAGFEVLDLGVNVSPEAAVDGVRVHNPDVVGLSALLTTTMPAMGRIIAAFERDGVTCPVIVGGAPVNRAFAERVGADGYAEDAPAAVELVKSLVGRTVESPGYGVTMAAE
jgi:5-methyltetrahydrofolate--homocysteine methyltransferase